MDTRPTPAPDFSTAPYWDNATSHRLTLPRCVSCGQCHCYPHPICPHCGGDAFDWIESVGVGHVYSFTIVRRAPSPAFQDLVPYTVAIIALDEGPHLMSNIVDCAVDDVAIGARVTVDFLDIEGAPSLPVFRLTASGGPPTTSR